MDVVRKRLFQSHPDVDPARKTTAWKNGRAVSKPSHQNIDPARIRDKRLYRILISDWLIHYPKRLIQRHLTRAGKYRALIG